LLELGDFGPPDIIELLLDPKSPCDGTCNDIRFMEPLLIGGILLIPKAFLAIYSASNGIDLRCFRIDS
jgi:hypothetical protein